MTTTADTELHEMAEAAIDEDVLAELLAQAADAECDETATAALHAVVADELVADVLAAVARARHLGRTPTGDDIGAAADHRRAGGAAAGRGRGRDSAPRHPSHAWVESS